MDDQGAFLTYVTERLGALPYVRAVALGGSRATGTHRPDSDWDLAVYYRGPFSPGSLRDLGWPGEVSEIGGWGGGVFNGGAWLTVGDRRVDVHYRDLDDVEHHLAEANEGRFRIERLLFHLVGVPTYIVVAELAVNQVLQGTLPCPEYPEALRRRARERWWSEAGLTLDYARKAHAVRGVISPTAPERSPLPPARRPTPYSRREASGSPTRRLCWSAPASAALTASSPA
jgi:predicted nucleotidyltransferase